MTAAAAEVVSSITVLIAADEEELEDRKQMVAELKAQLDAVQEHVQQLQNDLTENKKRLSQQKSINFTLNLQKRGAEHAHKSLSKLVVPVGIKKREIKWVSVKRQGPRF